MDYNFKQDLKAIREILKFTQMELAGQLGGEQKTISRNELGKNEPTAKLLEQVYAYALEKNIKLNKLKEMLWIDNLESDHRLLFHGAKSSIKGKLNVHIGRANNDFGQGFYAGECYEQAISFISGRSMCLLVNEQ